MILTRVGILIECDRKMTLDAIGVLVPCSSCGTMNRLKYRALERATKCGKCHASLPFPATPIDAADAQTFDAAVMMFAVLSYQLSNQDVLSTLATVRRHLQVGGLFIADLWYGPAVLNERPG